MPETISFDHYEVLTRQDGSPMELGRGAMGVTYKAIDTSLKMPVALKVITSKLVDNEVARQRFIREAQSAAKLRHRNVASVFHLRFTGEACFYAMEFIDGETLESFIRREGPQPPVAALRIALQVARALNAAAQHGLVHRDIKPANLMLVKEDDELCVKVIDFGLAKAQDGGDTESATLSMPGAFFGTALYASPEQMTCAEVDSRSDIYSLGATLWYMLAGEAPFSGTLAQVLTAQIMAPPPFEKLEGLPKPVEELLRKMLAKKPEERQQTAAILRQEIEQCIEKLSGGPMAAAAKAAVEEAAITDNIAVSATVDPSTFQPGALAAGRYEIVRSLGTTNLGAEFQAVDESHCGVRLVAVRPEWTRDPAVRARLRADLARYHELDHPNLLRIQAFDESSPGGLLLIEWTDGFSLLDLFRTRRQLSPAEIVPFVEQLASAIDYSSAAGIPRFGFWLNQIRVHFPGEGENARAFLQSPVTAWPHFELKLDPLDVSPAPRESDPAVARAAMVRGMARVAYELLGGPIPPLTASATPFRYTTLGSLPEAANALIRRAIDAPASFGSATEFASALAAALQGMPAPTLPTVSPERSAYGTQAPSQTQFPAPQPTHVPPPPKPLSPTNPALLIGAIALGMLLFAGLGGAAYWVVAKNHTPAVPHTDPQVPQGGGDSGYKGSGVIGGTDKEDHPGTEEKRNDSPAPDRANLLMAAYNKADALEKNGDIAGALAGWVGIAREFPEKATGKTQLEILTNRLHEDPSSWGNATFEQLAAALKDAAQFGAVGAMMILAEHSRDSAPSEAFRWFSQAAKANYAPAMVQAGLMVANGRGVAGDLSKAVEYFSQAATLGDAHGQLAYAECLLSGKGCPPDPKLGLEMLKKAAAQRLPRAEVKLGIATAKGMYGIRPSLEEALRLYTDAGEQGDGEAYGNMGAEYLKHPEIANSESQAASYFAKGAALQNGYAMFALGQCYDIGQGVPKNPAEARNWFRAAAEKGFPPAVQWCNQNGIPFSAPAAH